MMKRMIGILKKWLGKSSVSIPEKVQVRNFAETDAKPRKDSLIEKLETYLFARYDFRFNVLTEQTEYRCKGEEAFRLADRRMLNTFCIEARNQGINCWDKDVSRLLLSQKIADFHPFSDYADRLPEWDG